MPPGAAADGLLARRAIQASAPLEVAVATRRTDGLTNRACVGSKHRKHAYVHTGLKEKERRQNRAEAVARTISQTILEHTTAYDRALTMATHPPSATHAWEREKTMAHIRSSRKRSRS